QPSPLDRIEPTPAAAAAAGRAAIGAGRVPVRLRAGAAPDRLGAAVVSSLALLMAGLSCRRFLRQWNRQAANQALAAPVEISSTAKLRFDAGDHAAGPESARDRSYDLRTVLLFP